MLCDAQVHIWGADRPDRPWPEVHGTPHRPEPYGAGEVIAAMDRAGVERAVIVPPSWEGDRNDLAFEAVRSYPGRFGIMGRVELTAPDLDLLRAWRSTPGMLGVRLTFHRPESRARLTDGTAEWLYSAAEELALPVMVLAPGQNRALAELARRHPDLALVIDHLNLPVHADRAAIDPAIEALAPLVGHANVSIKISALPCYTDEAPPFSQLAGQIRRVVDRFGAERCMWGSDISRLPCRYEDWARLFVAGAGVLDGVEAEAVGGGTLCRVLRWGAPVVG